MQTENCVMCRHALFSEKKMFTVHNGTKQEIIVYHCPNCRCNRLEVYIVDEVGTELIELDQSFTADNRAWSAITEDDADDWIAHTQESLAYEARSHGA